MAYIINGFDGTQLTIVDDGILDTSTPVGLIGRNYTGYGEVQNENFIFLLENFANASPPARALSGQAWYDKGAKALKVYNGTTWLSIGNATVSEEEPAHSNGGLWLKTTTQQLYVSDGTVWRQVGPEAAEGFAVTKMTSTIIKDSLGTNKPAILSQLNGETTAIIVNEDFTINSTTEIPGFSQLTRGINLKSSNYFSGTLKGNADSASRLETSRTINSVAFNGTSDITITAVTNQPLVAGDFIIGSEFNGAFETTWDINATSENLIGTVVARNSVGGFSATTVNADLFGNVQGNVTAVNGTSTFNEIVVNNITGETFSGLAARTTRLATPRLINTVPFDGTQDITLPVPAETLVGTTLAPNVVDSVLTSLGKLVALEVEAPGIVVGDGNNLNIKIEGFTPTLESDVSNAIKLKLLTGSVTVAPTTITFVSASAASADGVLSPAFVPDYTLSTPANQRPVLGLPSHRWKDIYSAAATLDVLKTTTLSGRTVADEVTVSNKLIVNNGIYGALFGNVTGNVTGNLTGNVTGNLTGNVTGQASNALVWTNQRKVTLSGDVSGEAWIDGSANVTLTTTIVTNSVALGTDTTGNYVLSLVAGTGIEVTDNSGEGTTPVIKIANSYTTAMVSNISNSASSVSTYADTVGNTAYSNAVTYINNRTLDDLTGVTISNAATDQVVIYNGSAWVNNSLNLNKISNVLVTTPLNGQILQYDTSSSKWINAIIPESPSGTSIVSVVGNNTNTSFTIFHGFSTADVVVTVKSAITYEVVQARWSTTNSAGAYSDDHVTVNFTSAPATSEMSIAVYAAIQSTSVNITGRLDNLSGDVTISGAITGQSLFYNGSNWTNRKINLNTDIENVVISGSPTGQFLKHNGTNWVNDAIDLGTDTTGSFVSSLVAGTGITLANNSGENATPTITVDTSAIQARVANITDTEIGYLDGVTSAIQTQIDTKAPIASPTFTGTVSGITKTMVGLGSVDNTADTAKPVSTTQQTAIDLKANIASPTFTGTVTIPSGASISGFAPLASPTFTGTVTVPTGASITSPTLAGTTVTASGNLVVQPYTNILEVKGDGAAVVGQLQLNCHVNSHGQKIASQPHSQSASNTLKLPGGTTIGNADAVLVSDTGTQTLSNKTLASGTVATTQSAGNNSTAIATTAYVDTALSAVSVNFSSDQNVLIYRLFG
jgi:hypothetical protein